MFKLGIAPVATALVGLGVVIYASNVRAGGDKVVFPEGFDKGVLFTTVDRADNKQFRELYVSPPAAVEDAKKRLSDHAFTKLEEEFIAEKDGVPLHLSIEVSREEAPVQEVVMTGADIDLTPGGT